MSFKRQHLQTLSFPGEEARENWLCDVEGNCQPAERGGHAAGAVLAIEALALDSAPFWFLKREGAEQDTAEAVALRWEAFGIQAEGGAVSWAHWPVKETEKSLLISTLAIAAEGSPTEWSAAAGVERFEPSAKLLPLPADGLAVWKELGRYVVAFTNRHTLLHLTVLSSRILDADAAMEMRDVYQALLAHEFAVSPSNVEIWTHCETDFVPQMACVFDDAVFNKRSRPDPILHAELSGLLPIQVAEMRQQKRLQLRKVMIMAAAAMVYLFFFGAWWLRLQWRESRIQQETATIAALQPEMDVVREAQANWLDMEAAIDPNLYPVEIFHQLVLLLPDEGIRLKDFQMDNGKLIVGGEATTVNHALGFKDKLIASKQLQHYVWNFPVPRIRDEDNRAEFRAVGTINGEGANEGQ